MFKSFLFVVLSFSSVAYSEEFGIEAGIHQSDADTRRTGDSHSGDFGYRAGLTTSFFLEGGFKIRSGLMYVQRHFDLKDSSGSTTTYNWAYIDIPVLLQYNFTDKVGLFGGVNIAINTDTSTSPSIPIGANPTFTPIFTLGLNFLFDNMYGFDVFYERGYTPIETRAANINAYGVSLIYYFL
jgi:hypothetical protein